jgi:IS30 family transposase
LTGEVVVAKRVWRRLDRDVRRRIVRLAAKGWTREQIAREVCRSTGSISNVLLPLGGTWRSDEGWEPPPKRLSVEDRVEIKVGLELRMSFAALGRLLGKATSTVSREVAANGGRKHYRPIGAHRRACARARRPKPTKLAAHPMLCARVIADLEALWSPEQIARRLREEFPGDTTMWVSHETIYKSLYVQGRGELRRELTACLRTGRAQRRPRGRLEHPGRIKDMVMISERPADVADRAVPGHWEGDLIIGKNGKSAIGTLVERSTRYVMLLYLPSGRTAEDVRNAMTTTIRTLPTSLRRSLTWDQGVEMAGHAQFSIDTGVDVYFCDPHAPWQRGSNENTNGLLRQYFPKGTDLSVHNPATLQAAADSLNGRPRKTLGWRTPAEKLAELIAATG